MKLLFWSGKSKFLIALLLITALGACKKSKVNPDPVDPAVESNTKQTPTTNRRELTNDSLFLYAKQIYFWNTTLPSYDVFEPRKYKTYPLDLDNFRDELFNITKYSTFETVPGANYSKYAYIVDNTESNGNQASAKFASLDANDVGYDMGIVTFRNYGTETNYTTYVAGVYPNSPAANAGITRGTQITKIGNVSIGTNFNSVVQTLNAVLNNRLTTALFSGIKADGTPFTDVRLTIARYNSSSVFTSKVITQGGKNVGYFAYSRFSVLTVGGKTPSDVRLDPVFAEFASKGVTDLVIDLRYNGGGSVETAEYLLNLIAPSTATGKMYQELYNNTMKTGKATILEKQPLTDGSGKILYSSSGKMYTYDDVDWTEAGNTYYFSKKGSLTGVKNIVFLVSGGTASASEMLINCIKPHVQSVKLVGTKTYGKPVGFFPILLDNRYNAYIPSFETRNSRGEGGYYAGMTPDYLDDGNNGIVDDAKYDFGNPNEGYLKTALSILAPVAQGVSSGRTSSVASTPAGNIKTLTFANDNIENVGMIETRFKIKK
ncbi:S41 family peptidase [Pedobacter sp. ASV1-7]|uniref:S41 family peptidase n=1 Tax=Pedobacter sp. ASV1-7 TaxID=3145237 RepID=UPI0032E88964